MFRITDGFKLEEFESKAANYLKRQKNGALAHSTGMVKVFPEEACITKVCWNPNEKFGGWAAAGAACGLVRIEDVAV
ncbi:hypothetical protein RUND412_002554 [Rhizina undulata]